MLHKEFGLVSIIMAAYNAEKTIEQAINSVLNQTYTNFELLVVNDCSKDGTVESVKSIAATDGRVRLISNEKNSGVSYTRKHGLEEANGSWIAILDSDDAWAPEKLEKQIELQNRTNADLLFTGSTFMDSDGQLIDWYLHAPAEITYRQLLKQNVFLCACPERVVCEVLCSRRWDARGFCDLAQHPERRKESLWCG